MKKVIITFFAILLVITTVVPISAAAAAPEIITGEVQETPSPRAEQTEWYFRIYNGKLQKRLWSITYGYWKTDWINVGE